ncbi:hypothetical protein KI387_023267, partial [Taxus chinensis]
MAGRDRIPHPYGRQLPIPGMMRPESFGPVMGPFDMLPPPEVLERKLAAQNVEMQRLASDNQMLAATHVALRQELAAIQRELERLHAHMTALQNDSEQQVRSLLEKNGRMEADLQAAESIKNELQQTRADAQSLMSVKQELSAQVQQLSNDLQKARMEAQQIPAIQAEIDNLRQDLQRARNAFEYEKATNNEQMEQMQKMEKNLISMAREVEKLRAEISSVSDNRSRAVSYGDAYGGPDSSFPSAGQNMYRDGYGMSQVPVGPENVSPYAAGGGLGWGGYDVPRGAGSN